MARTPKAPINPEVAAWARQVAGHTVDSAAKGLGVKPEQLTRWEHDEDAPTVGQLRKMAALYRRTPAFFFLPEAPALDRPTPPDFRGVEADEVSPGLHREIDRAIERRKAAIEFKVVPPRAFEGFAADLRTLEQAAQQLRSYLEVSIEEQTAPASDANSVLNRWISALEDSGVLVFHMSRISQAESRGFSIFEEQAPVIVLNGADPPQARAFTLFHEVCHLLHRSGGICTLFVDEQVERRCNAFAGHVLMPRQEFLAALGSEEPRDAIARLASRFKVSQDAAAIRLRSFGRLDQSDVDEVLAATQERVAMDKAKQKASDGGPPHHRTHLRNLGPRYVTSILTAMEGNEISRTEAAHYLEAKVSTIDRMEAELQTRASR